MRLASLGENPRDAGWVTSVAHSAMLKKIIALGFVKRGFNAPGTKLCASMSGAADSTVVSAEVAALPFIAHG
jgi:glycine cleavage system aminomethyltransferase T